MKHDLTKMLQAWPYQAGQVLARRFKGRDGQQKIQLRVDLGVLQMNAEGRPDGKRPMGQESWFEVYRGRLADHLLNKGTPDTFRLGLEECVKLQQECIQFHHRYICLFQLEDFMGVMKDADRNLKVFEFVAEHAATEELAWSLLQFVPQLLLMRTRATGTMALKEDNHAGALTEIEEGILELEQFYTENERLDLMDQSPELASLREWHGQVAQRRPISEMERLKQDLAEAILREDYEQAAAVRDKIRKMQASDS